MAPGNHLTLLHHLQLHPARVCRPFTVARLRRELERPVGTMVIARAVAAAVAAAITRLIRLR